MRSILVPIICFLIVLATVMAQATEKTCAQIFTASEQSSQRVVSPTAEDLEKQDIDLPESMDRTDWRAAFARLVKHQWPMSEKSTAAAPQESASPASQKPIPAKILKDSMIKYKENAERRSQESIARRVFLAEKSEKVSALLARLDAVFPEIFSTYHQQLMKSRGNAERVPSRYRPYAQLKSKHKDVFDSIIAPIEAAENSQEVQALFQISEQKITNLLQAMAAAYPQQTEKAYQGLIKIQDQVEKHNLQLLKMIGRRALVHEYLLLIEPGHLKHLPKSDSDIDKFYGKIQSQQIFVDHLVTQLMQASSVSMADRMIDEGLIKIREAADPVSSIHNLTLKEALDKIVKEDFFQEIPMARLISLDGDLKDNLFKIASQSQEHHHFLWKLLNLQRRANLSGIPWNGQQLSLMQRSENEDRLRLKEFFLRQLDNLKKM